MLEKLFISKVRLKMLRQFLFNQEESYHVRAMVRALDEEINAVRRELQNLELVGLLQSERRGNRLIYKLNPESIYIKDLTNLLKREDPEVKTIVKESKKVPALSHLVLTNNYFTQKYDDKQDVDMLIIADTDVSQINELIKRLESKLSREVRVAAIKTSDLPFYVKKRDKILLNILSKDRISLVGSDNDFYKYE